MGSTEKSKKKTQLYKKAIVHFILCFIVGFFTGFTPSSKSSIQTQQPAAFSPNPTTQVFQKEDNQNGSYYNRGLLDQNTPVPSTSDQNPRRLVIVITPTSIKDKLRGMFLRKLAYTLKLVPPPLLWVVVEQQQSEDDVESSSEVSEILRKTGIMYRHVVFKENFTDYEDEMDHQRNLALNHIDHHRLSGIVHFAGLSNVYDLTFFDEIREIEAFGTWPMAMLVPNKKKVIIEGPICDSSEVIGWHLRNRRNITETITTPVHISSFAFNSSILWDPERWGRPTSVKEDSHSQNSLKFVKKEVLEEETKLKGIPTDGCSRIMLWNLHFPSQIDSFQA
ncbi:beta-1,4-xylosyltransferase IRX9 [Impatiens glandulifera]|uniref:beta-1,4-xylosyltransferase IRX9 n=1 Tax=Impatiens glandulifera TaxID=253017 RepID=UPI001FB14EEF|nr:beta-1,4-xylosyltransferase IRX9 [Impatiens glandulifera]